MHIEANRSRMPFNAKQASKNYQLSVDRQLRFRKEKEQQEQLEQELEEEKEAEKEAERTKQIQMMSRCAHLEAESITPAILVNSEECPTQSIASDGGGGGGSPSPTNVYIDLDLQIKKLKSKRRTILSQNALSRIADRRKDYLLKFVLPCE